MLQLDPTHRLTIADILASPWMQGEMPSKSEIIKEFMARDQLVK
jgi:hypothetical protein